MNVILNFLIITMSAYEKSQNKHAARCEKDNRSTCPSKLSKRELEDLYYSLLENNLELKKTINAQNEKNRILSTKVQRMTAQTKSFLDNKDCCAAGKAIINEQKAAIADLTKANNAMTDRLRRLSTQLCTAKQFLKQNPKAHHCYKCYVNATTSVKNLSTTSLQNKTSDVNLKSLATSARSPERDPPTTMSAGTNDAEKDVENEIGDAEKICNANRCRTTMEDFKRKIEELEEELAKTHVEYSSRMTQLENQVSRLQTAAVRARSEQGARARDEALGLARQLRDRSADKVELETLLSIEKKKVAELEMRLKAAEMSQQVAKTIEGHLNTANRLEEKKLHRTSIQGYSISSNLAPEDESPRRTPTTPTSKRLNELTVPEDKLSKSDDSGYADPRRDSFSDEKSIDRIDQELARKISELQAQLDALKSSLIKNDNADTASYRKAFTPYDKHWLSEQKTKQQNMIQKRPQISILEPENMVSNKPSSAQDNITKEHGYNIDKLESNDPDRDASSLKNEKREMDSVTKESDGTNVSHKDHGSTSCCGKGKNKDNESEVYSPTSKATAIDKGVGDVSEIRSSAKDNITKEHSNNIDKLERNDPDRDSSSLKIEKREMDSVTKQSDERNVSHKDHGSTSCCGRGKKKDKGSEVYSPTSKYTAIDKDVGDVSEIRSKRDTQEILQSRLDNYESQEIKPKTPDYSSPEETSSRRPSIVQTPKSIRKTDDHIYRLDNYESQEIKPKTPDYSSPEETSSRRSSIVQTPKSSNRKTDDHIYQQIPGPLPTHRDSASSKRSALSKEELATNWKKARNYGKRKSKDDVPNKKQTFEVDKTVDVTKDEYMSTNLKNNQAKINTDGENCCNSAFTVLKNDDDKDVSNAGKDKRLVTDVKSTDVTKTAQQETKDVSNAGKDKRLITDVKSTDVTKTAQQETKDVSNAGKDKRLITDVKSTDVTKTAQQETKGVSNAGKDKRLITDVKSTDVTKTAQQETKGVSNAGKDKRLITDVKSTDVTKTAQQETKGVSNAGKDKRLVTDVKSTDVTKTAQQETKGVFNAGKDKRLITDVKSTDVTKTAQQETKGVSNAGKDKRLVTDVKSTDVTKTAQQETKGVSNAGKDKRLITDVKSTDVTKTAQQETLYDSFKHSIQEKPVQKNVEELATPSGAPSDMKNGRTNSRDRVEMKSLQLDKSGKPDNKGTNQELSTIDEFGAVLRDAPIGTSTPKAQNKAAAPISPQTYTLDSEGKRTRATSPDNTDNEISGMSDLPTEKETTSPREVLSPGEHKTTTTTTESYTHPHEMTLSEGEVPVSKYAARKNSKSVGEASNNDYPMRDNSLGEYRSSSEMMEAALQAISEELARCRWLLQTQRTREKRESKEVATGLDDACDSVILYRARGMMRIEGIDVPTCLFIVHIATVLLADEAVVSSRDERFILTWKFFDNDCTVTPMGVGRVLNFHFSTQYYLEMTKEVVNYLSNEDMLIMMWEVGSTKTPFATCALPLEQVLINANKRVDFSLPLRDGSCLSETSNVLNASHDIGVLDAWCMLHCDRLSLPGINRANNGISKNLPDDEQPNKVSNANIQEQQKQGNQSMDLPDGKRVSTSPDGRLKHSTPPFSDRKVLELTVLWLTLYGNCEALLANDDRRLYVAYTFLGRDEAELETPTSLPKPKNPTDKCIFNFKKCFNLTETDMQILKHMVSCRSQGRNSHNSKNCIVFAVVSEPPEDPLGLENCEDIGFAFLYLGDLLAYSLGDSLIEVLPVYAVRSSGEVCGSLAVQVDGLYVLRALKEETE